LTIIDPNILTSSISLKPSIQLNTSEAVEAVNLNKSGSEPIAVRLTAIGSELVAANTVATNTVTANTLEALATPTQPINNLDSDQLYKVTLALTLEKSLMPYINPEALQDNTSGQQLQFYTKDQVLPGQSFKALASIVLPEAGSNQPLLPLKISSQSLQMVSTAEIQSARAADGLIKQLQQPALQAGAGLFFPMTQSLQNDTAPTAIDQLLPATKAEMNQLKASVTLSLNKSFQATPPMAWIADNPLRLPTWLEQLPQITQKNLVAFITDRVSQWLETAPTLNQPLTHKNTRAYSSNNNLTDNNQHNPSSTTSKAATDETIKNQVTSIQSWVKSQNIFLKIPAAMPAINIFQHMTLPQPNTLAITQLHHQLTQVWPEYTEAQLITQVLSQYTDTKAGHSLSPEEIVQKLVVLMQKYDHDSNSSVKSSDLLNALVLKTAIAKLASELAPQTDPFEQTSRPIVFGLPLEIHQQSTWVDITIDQNRSNHTLEENSQQVITLDFECDALGFIRSQLIFNEGFYSAHCIAAFQSDQSATLQALQQHQDTLLDHLQRSGLSVDQIQWHKGRPTSPPDEHNAYLIHIEV